MAKREVLYMMEDDGVSFVVKSVGSGLYEVSAWVLHSKGRAPAGLGELSVQEVMVEANEFSVVGGDAEGVPAAALPDYLRRLARQAIEKGRAAWDEEKRAQAELDKLDLGGELD